jgi:hypothetical protein
MNQYRTLPPRRPGAPLYPQRPRGPVRPRPLPPEQEKSKKAPLNKKLILLFVVLGIYGIYALWDNWPKPSLVPRELIGTWRTSDPRYEGRSFEIGYVSINFGTGNGTVSTGFINNVEGVKELFRTLYTIGYTQEGKQIQVTFYYDLSKGRKIYFKNQPGVLWVKDKDI